jgi:TetR/AcrR family transcriptional regulator, regulator of cefoperazone and chloramphenicol sensitivity
MSRGPGIRNQEPATRASSSRGAATGSRAAAAGTALGSRGPKRGARGAVSVAVAAEQQKRGAAVDLETRERLIESAATLFAANGYAKVSVRHICAAAAANVAAVNYHFGGKTGLYEQVLRRAITVMQATTTEAIDAGAGRHPREQLKAYLSVFMRRVFAGRDSWIHQMMMRELADPTPALDLVVAEVMKPRMEYLSRVIASLLDAPPTDSRVRLCAVGVQAQCLAVLRSGFSDRLGMIPVDERSIDDVAEHIARFSLGGIRAIASA